MNLSNNGYPKRIAFPLLIVLLCLISVQATYASTIGGIVFGHLRNPLGDVDMELLNENYNILARTKTDATGRYLFRGMPDGRYYVKALPFRYNYHDRSEEVEVTTLSLIGEGSGNFSKDLYLVWKKGGLAETTTGVVFAQEVPKEARAMFKTAIDDLKNEQQEAGMNKLLKAINIFPEYYAASQTLGMQFLFTKQYLEAAQMFLRAAEVNPKSSRSFYWLGFALNSIGPKYNRASLQALKKAAVLAPASFEVALLTGKVHREQKNFAEAEILLLKAKKLARTKVPEIHKELAQLYGNDLKKFKKAADELEAYLKASNKKKDEKTKKQIADLRAKAAKS